MHFITMKLLKSIHTVAGAPSGLIRLPFRVNRNTLFPGPVPKKNRIVRLVREESFSKITWYKLNCTF